MRSIWSGAISFGLINIPVRLYSATEEKRLDFDMLRKKDMCRIRFARVCRETGEEVPYKEIVKGYEYQEGDYVILEDEDFKQASPKKTQTIDVQSFADEKEIDPKFFDKPYYLEPGKGAAKAYVLLREALKKSKRVGIAKFVLRTREHIAAVKAEDDHLVLNQLRFATEIRKAELDVPADVKTSKKEVEMALELINQLTEPFNPEEYKDEYTQALLETIERKAKGKELKPVKETIGQPTDVADIMEKLKASLENAKTKKPERVRTHLTA